jgi:hypothetical protein
VEIEIEYIGNLRKLDIKSIEQILHKFPKKCIDINQSIYFNKILWLQQYLEKKFVLTNKISIKQLLPSAIDFSKSQYCIDILPNIDNFMITHKINGERCILFISPEVSGYLSSDKWKELTIDTKVVMVLDGELFNNIYYIFDILYFKENEQEHILIKNSFYERYNFLNKILSLFTSLNIKIQLKMFWQLSKNNYQKIINDLIQKKVDYEIDGLILNETDKDYLNTTYYKWKLPQYNSIDFVCRRCPDDLINTGINTTLPDYTLYWLFVGIRSHMANTFQIETKMTHKLFNKLRPDYYPVLFQPDNNPHAYIFHSKDSGLDNKIVELVYNDNNWTFLKVRTDRENDLKNNQYYGNDYKTAEMTWYNNIYPLTIQDLTSSLTVLQSQLYFNKSSATFADVRKFNNLLKSNLLNIYKKASVLDLSIFIW